MRFALNASAKSDVGLKRHGNEDSFGYDAKLGIFLLCDGMGGHAGGEVASKLAVETILQFFRTVPYTKETATAALDKAIRLANTAIREAARKPSLAGMGSTVVSLLLADGHAYIGSMGDSRIYLIRGKTIRQMTNDHSLVAEQMRRGFITADEAARSNMQNIVLRALGVAEEAVPETTEIETLADDIFLLACDGLTKFVSDPEMLQIVSRAGNLETACADLIQAAKDHESDDNITCLLVQLRKAGWFNF